jgi:hypothetical protein
MNADGRDGVVGGHPRPGIDRHRVVIDFDVGDGARHPTIAAGAPRRRPCSTMNADANAPISPR